jgi:4-carboxymuconolactone decarboxylase
LADPSGARRLLRPEELTDEQQALYDELCAGPRADAGRPAGPVDAEGRLTGPFNAMLHSPAVGGPLQRLGAALRYESALPDDVRETLTCLVAGLHDSAYEWHVHAPLARRAGVDEATLDALGQGRLPADAGPELRLAHALLTGPPHQHALAGDPLQELGPVTVLEVSTLVGYYTTLAWQLRLFGVTAPEATDG